MSRLIAFALGVCALGLLAVLYFGVIAEDRTAMWIAAAVAFFAALCTFVMDGIHHAQRERNR